MIEGGKRKEGDQKVIKVEGERKTEGGGGIIIIMTGVYPDDVQDIGDIYTQNSHFSTGQNEHTSE